MVAFFRILKVFLFVVFMSATIPGLLKGPNEQAISSVEWRSLNKLSQPKNTERKELLAFFNSLEAFFADRIWERSELVKLYAIANYALERNPFPKEVILGKEGWFFLGNRYGNIIDKHMGRLPFTENELPNMISQIKAFNDICKERGIPFVFSTTPDTHFVYPEKLPDWVGHPKRPTRREKLILEARRFGLSAVDLADGVVKVKELGKMAMYPRGAHWTALGAFEAGRLLFTEMLTQLGVNDLSFFEDANLEYLNGEDEETGMESHICYLYFKDITQKNTMDPYPYFREIPLNSKISVTDKTGNEQEATLANPGIWPLDGKTVKNPRAFFSRRALFFCDSYMVNLFKYTSSVFQETIYYNHTGIFSLSGINVDGLKKILDKTKPDIVAIEFAERMGI